MNAEQAFDHWAPNDAAWSDWARPALFLGLNEQQLTPDNPDVTGVFPVDALPTDALTAVVLDLPGHLGLQVALTLAERGRRPVPVINTTWGPRAALDLTPHLRELLRGAALLPSLGLPPQAPPTFVLDHARLAPGWIPRPKLYDNRWLVYPQDFPSAAHLRAAGYRRVVVARYRGDVPGEDLDHVLVRWREGGLTLHQIAADGETLDLHPVVPGGLRSLLRRATSLMGLTTNSAGGFGSRVPEPSEGASG